MADQGYGPKQADMEISRAKKLSRATQELRSRAMELVKHLESEEVPDVKDLSALHKKLVREEKALARLLRPVPGNRGSKAETKLSSQGKSKKMKR